MFSGRENGTNVKFRRELGIHKRMELLCGILREAMAVGYRAD
jgi:hypothetical protein